MRFVFNSLIVAHYSRRRRFSFKPLGVNRDVAQNEQLKGRGYLDWYRDLSCQVEMVIPARTRPIEVYWIACP